MAFCYTLFFSRKTLNKYYSIVIIDDRTIFGLSWLLYGDFIYMKKKEIVSVIPIKMNNERLPGKNTKYLGSMPLIYYVQQMLLNVPEIEKRYVYCSNPDIQKYLLDGTTFLKRCEKLDLPESNFTQIFNEFSSDVSADVYVYAHATAPFVSPKTTRECIKAVVSGDYDSAFCAVKIQDYLWQNGKPLNFSADNIPRSQDLEPIYRETSGTYVFTREVFEKYKRRVGVNPYIKIVDFKEAVDINTPEDFTLAEIMIREDIFA